MGVSDLGIGKMIFVKQWRKINMNPLLSLLGLQAIYYATHHEEPRCRRREDDYDDYDDYDEDEDESWNDHDDDY